MKSQQKNRRLGRYVTGAAALLLAGGLTVLGFGIWGNVPPPRPPVSAATPLPSGSAAAAESISTPASAGESVPGESVPGPTASGDPVAAGDDPSALGPALEASNPTHISIPSIDVDSALMDLGLNEDGSLEVPPFEKDSPAGWYRGSPTPGEIGPSIILGHVDTYKAGPVVFYRLGDTRPGDKISVTREDDTVAVFTVDRVESFPKADFPELEVYGNTDTAQLRLITCGGDYTDHQYVDDVVVFATLVSSHPA